MATTALILHNAFTMSSASSKLGLVQTAASQLKSLLKSGVENKHIFYKASLASYAFILMFSALRSKLDLPKQPPSDSPSSAPAAPRVRRRPSTVTAREPVHIWSSAAASLGRVRSDSAPLPRTRSGSLTGPAVANRRMSISS